MTNARGHSGSGEAWGGVILLLPWGLLILSVSGGPCSMQEKPGPQSYLTCIRTEDHISTQDLLERMLFDDLAKVLGTRRIRWHIHVKRSDGWLKKVQKLNAIGGRSCGCLKKTWTEVTAMDCVALGWTEIHPSDRKAWSGRLRSAVRLDPSLRDFWIKFSVT